jgi:hypothetical protein
VTAASAAKTLNRLLAKDPSALTELCSYRVPCSAQLADDSGVQVLEDEMGTLVGMLGIINALLGSKPDGTGKLAAVQENGLIVRFEAC